MRTALLSVWIILISVSMSFGEDKPAADAAPAMDAAMLEAMKYAAPGKEHEQLASLAGTFTADVSMWMAPGAEPQKSTGELKSEMILGGRYLQGTYTGSFMGQPFHGISLMGYDNYAGKYFNLWIDDMSTIAMVSRGTTDAEGKVLTLTGDFECPMTKSTHATRQVMTVIDADTHKFEMFDQEPGKEETKVMEIIYTRVK